MLIIVEVAGYDAGLPADELRRTVEGLRTDPPAYREADALILTSERYALAVRIVGVAE